MVHVGVGRVIIGHVGLGHVGVSRIGVGILTHVVGSSIGSAASS